VARADHVHPSDASRASLASPAFTGIVTVSATNSLTLAGSTSGPVQIASSGTSGISLGTASNGEVLRLVDNGGTTIGSRANIAYYSPLNRWDFGSGGSASNVSLYANGGGQAYLIANGGVQFVTASISGTANYLQVAGAASGNSPSLSAIGSGTNLNIGLLPKGAGLVLLGSVGVATASSGAATLNSQRGTVTSESGLTTPAGSDYVLTLTNSSITSSSIVMATADNGTNTTEGVAVNRVTPSSGSAVVRIRNTNASTAWNGSVKLNFVVLN
jgi:hypothetical protein